MVYAVNLQYVFSIFDKIPARFNIGIMLFMASFVSYMLRVNFSIIIIKMSADTNATTHQSTFINNSQLPAFNESTDIYKKHHIEDEHYAWDKKDQGLLLSAYFYGYIFPNLLGGSLADLYGGRKVIFITIFLSAFITSISPFTADNNFIYMFIMRFILGLLGGCLYPVEHHLISKWSPVEEKGKFVSTLLGGIFGTLITWPVTGFLSEHYGWKFGFYVPAAFAFIISIFWLYFVHDSPKVHPRISEKEREFIEKSLGTSSKKKTWPPMNKVLTSLPFYSLLLLHFGGTFGLFFFLTAAPKFMSEVLKFNLTEAGFLSSMPYLARLLFGFVFGSIGDTLKQKNILSTTAIRKSFCVFSHIIPGVFLIILCLVGYDPYICVAIMTLSLGFNGAATHTNLQNSQDLAPNYAGTLYGMINFVGTMSGFISPTIVAYFTQENSTMKEWQWIFIIGACVYIIPGIFFIIFGSGEVQKWNNLDEDKGQSNAKSKSDNTP
ncbi:hypothetical protein PVAND_007635 [Polypedilum vanderplanki]|uniref:Major facilitator superfamily (MFS) profile domain-containing protein n=1 Tax=Polypedilum vanderplanki TaxID=319348 RepID=A0A9J6C7J5_POLVA|nr:hypothetical protein PVAND_007635 [Polypedilum vanderplanki]